jgi:putative transposase
MSVSAIMGVEIVAWVIMPEHFHLLNRMNNFEVPLYLKVLKGPFGQQVIARWRILNAPILERIRTRKGFSFWMPGGGHDDPVVSLDELGNMIRYIHNNPVRRGLVEKPTDWKWSSAREHAEKYDSQR